MPRRLAALELATSSWVALAVAAFCDLQLGEALVQPRTAAELAALGYGREDGLFRLLRALCAYDVVRVAPGGRFGLGYAGRALAGDDSVRAMALYANADWHLRAYTRMADAIREERPGFEVSEGESLFAFLRRDDRAGAAFDAAMRSLAPTFADAFAAAYSFAPDSHVVDIGGGSGALLEALLRRNTSLRGTLFDLPVVVARANANARDPNVAPRLSALPGDIFTNPPPAADAYVLSHVLHDWDDRSCAVILRAIRDVMNAGAVVLIYDLVVPAPNNRWSQDRLTDLEMLAMLPGKERTTEEFEALARAANLRLNRIIPTGAAESIVELIIAS